MVSWNPVMGINPRDLNFPTVLCRNRLWRVQLGINGKYDHYFGGEINLSVDGHPTDQPPFHRVLTVDSADPRIWLERPIGQIPLLYGYLYDGCHLRYQFDPPNTIKVLSHETRGLNSTWPYLNYPAFFPQMPFELGDPIEIDRIEDMQLTWQSLDDSKDSDVIAIIPPEVGGAKLWDDIGIDDHVQTVIVLDAEKRTVESKNQCT